MFFSISVPVYNAEKYLDRCINSILSQTFSDFELILVDDGSTDKSLEICNNWKAKFPDKIKVVHKANSGSLFTRRICLFESAGEYLYVMDADDYKAALTAAGFNAASYTVSVDENNMGIPTVTK